jgi:hypothetical protein
MPPGGPLLYVSEHNGESQKTLPQAGFCAAPKILRSGVPACPRFACGGQMTPTALINGCNGAQCAMTAVGQSRSWCATAVRVPRDLRPRTSTSYEALGSSNELLRRSARSGSLGSRSPSSRLVLRTEYVVMDRPFGKAFGPAKFWQPEIRVWRRPDYSASPPATSRQ